MRLKCSKVGSGSTQSRQARLSITCRNPEPNSTGSRRKHLNILKQTRRAGLFRPACCYMDYTRSRMTELPCPTPMHTLNRQRKRVVEGKGGSGRVNSGGDRYNQKKNTAQNKQ